MLIENISSPIFLIVYFLIDRKVQARAREFRGPASGTPTFADARQMMIFIRLNGPCNRTIAIFVYKLSVFVGPKNAEYRDKNVEAKIIDILFFYRLSVNKIVIQLLKKNIY
jgi:hypothetical protein